MGKLTLVRHGQASFLADDYDNLSDLGQQQAERLGAYWAKKNQKFDAVYLGTLRRHEQTLQGILKHIGPQATPVYRAELNEYDSHAVISCTHPAPLPPRDTVEGFKQHFRILRDGLRQWMDGTVQPTGMPSYQVFADGIMAVAKEICREHTGKNVLIVSSGGPISTVVGRLLGTMPETTVELNYQIRNTALVEARITPKHLRLMTFNGLPHLDLDGDEVMHTYA